MLAKNRPQTRSNTGSEKLFVALKAPLIDILNVVKGNFRSTERGFRTYCNFVNVNGKQFGNRIAHILINQSTLRV